MTACIPLVQIRSMYRTEWQDLAFSVESGSDECTLRVEEIVTHRLLYTARRGRVAAAQAAAAEFGIFRVLGPASGVSPEVLASTLAWRRQI
uniref:Uncharacterized protein n=1 Tax=Solibacter usitatus (strain Ellin6076) TaxID=234267 RepID=Q024Z4_SOLUE